MMMSRSEIEREDGETDVKTCEYNKTQKTIVLYLVAKTVGWLHRKEEGEKGGIRRGREKEDRRRLRIETMKRPRRTTRWYII